MELIRLESAQDSLFEAAFDLYRTSFPQHEQRSRYKQAALMANPQYHFDVILENGACSGILLYWAFRDYTYIEHFAIDASRRGNALGSRCLTAFCEAHSTVILEIDPPVDPVSIRREVFYQKRAFQSNGYRHIHPAYQAGAAPHKLVVMSYPGTLSESAYAQFHMDLCHIVMRDMAS